jgi:hypothetical protein
MRTLEEIINQSYVLFEHYSAERPLDVCTVCCMAIEDEIRLAGLPVKDIPQDLLANYNDSAKPVKTSIEEVKHFLPRYLDLVGQFKFPSHSSELSFSRLRLFDKKEWPPAEWQLLGDFAEAFFRKCLSTYPLPSFERIENILIMLWRTGFEIQELLTIWGKDRTQESVLHFRDLYFYAFTNEKKKLVSSFSGPDLAVLLSGWMEQAMVKENFSAAIEALFMMKNDLNEKDSNELNLLYDLISCN